MSLGPAQKTIGKKMTTVNQPAPTEPNAKFTRSYRGMIVSPRRQAKLIFLFVTGGIFAMSAFFILFTASVNAQIEALTYYEVKPDIIEMLHASVNSSAKAMQLFSIGLALLLIGAGFYLSHRIYGPMVPIKRQIVALINGQYEARGKLRPKDEFHELMELLNQLAVSLEERHAKK